MTKTKRPAPLKKRWNADGSVTLYCRGRKVARFMPTTFSSPSRDAQTFIEGWFGKHEPRMLKTEFGGYKA